MYTRCSECETLFRVTREQLNAARGQVRCGRCGLVFDALAALREEITFDPQPDPIQISFSTATDADAERHDDVDDEVDAAIRYELLPPPRPHRRVWPWALAAFLFALTLTAQVIHSERERLAAHADFGPYVSMAYEHLGLVLVKQERYDLAAFALLHHELVTHPRSDGALHLSGVLSNEADFAQPWPILELRLEDRFGDIIAARRLQPTEYLRNPPDADGLIPAQARRAVEIEFLDPGHDAVGFSFDFCVMLREGLRCATQSSPLR